MNHNFLKHDCSSEKESRLVYNVPENFKLPESDSVDKRKVDIKLNELAWRTVKAPQKVEQSVKENGYQPDKIPNIDMTKPIDPTPANLTSLLATLNKVFEEVLPMQYGQLYAGETINMNARLLRDMPQAFLMRAITENGSPNALIKKFRAELSKIENKANNVDLLVVPFNKLVDLFRWLVDTGKWDLAPHGNPNLDDTPNAKGEQTVKPHHKVFLTNAMIKLEEYYRERIEDKQGHWYGNDYDNDRKDFLDEIELPFYREYYLNRAILEKTDAEKLAEDYSNFLVGAYTDCIKDPEDKIKQEEDDRLNEKMDRNKGYGWLTPYRAIIEAVDSK